MAYRPLDRLEMIPPPEIPDESQVSLVGNVRPTPLLDRIDLAGESARRAELRGLKERDLSKNRLIV